VKILITTSTFWPNSDGVANVTLNHALGFLRAGHKVVVATSFHPMRGHLPWPELTVEQFRVTGTANLFSGISGETRQYQEFVSTFNGDVIFFHCWQSWTTDLVLSRLNHLRLKRVLVSHGVSTNTMIGSGPSALLRWLGWRPYVWRDMPRTMPSLDAIVFLSERVDRDRFYDRRLASTIHVSRTAVIPNGVSLEAHDNSLPGFRRRYGLGDKLVLLCVGTFTEMKDEMKVAKAVLRSGIEGASLVLVGPEINQYAREINAMWAMQQRRAATVSLLCLADLTPDEILSTYREADIYLCGSRTECFPLVLLDAMASRTPFVSTPVGCVPDLRGGMTAATEESMGDCIARLGCTPFLRKQLGAEGRADCERRYNWPSVMAQYDRLLRDLYS